MAKFDLKQLIAEGKVSELDTSRREQIEYIDIDQIDDDPNNFYELSGVDELAANIELFGLQQPVRVRTSPDDASRVIIVSGHRRRAAIRKLVDEGRADLREIACIREASDGSAALQELRLIYANSDTRKMSSADISKQAERVETLLYQLKEEGYEFPGRMRDHVAEACNVSKSKLARLKVIRENLNPIWMPHWDNGALGESVTYALAQMPAEDQRALYLNRERRGLKINMLYENTVKTYAERLEKIAGCQCRKGPCGNQMQKREKALNMDQWQWMQCDKCCSECTDLLSCKQACPLLADEIKKRKEERKMEKQQEKLEQEAKDRPYIEAIQKLWYRFGEARIRANMDMEDVIRGFRPYVTSSVIEEAIKLEAGEVNVTRHTGLPYDYGCSLDDVQKYVGAADVLKCSLDWLLCRTDDPKGMGAAPAAPTPGGAAWYPPSVTPPDGAEIVMIDHDGDADFGRYAAGTLQDTIYCEWSDVACWTMAPDRDKLTVPPVAVTEKPPCDLCKSAHPWCDDCCSACDNRCNGCQDCRKTEITPPAEGWVPLQWINGMERPEKGGQLAAVKLAVEGMDKTVTKLLKWDSFKRQWCFPNNAGAIKAECVGWFPLPEGT